jgi:glycosyltransferase involved in cell wall biosynthesis
MKIAQVTSMADSRGGGVSEVVFNLTTVLSRMGHEATIYGRVKNDETQGMLARVVGQTAPKNGRELVRRLASAPPDVVHSHGFWDPMLNTVQKSARRAGVPVVISPHGMLDAWALNQSWFKKKLALASYERRNLARATCIHALTNAEAAAVRVLAPLTPIAVIPNGVNLPATTGHPEINGVEKQLLFLGRIHPKKGILELVEAFGRLANNPVSARWRLDIAGWDDGGHLCEVEARIAQLGLGSRVRLLGPVFGAEKDSLIARATALALTSYSEGLPMTVLEAWANARPVLITPECNLPEAGPEGAAVVCQTGVEGVTLGLLKLLTMTPKERYKMGAAGRALAATRYDSTQVARDMESLYQWIKWKGKRPHFVSFSNDPSTDL